MDRHLEEFESVQATEAEHTIRCIQLLNCHIEGFQSDLEAATRQFALAMENLAETRGHLKMAQQALERIARASEQEASRDALTATTPN